MRTLDPGTFQQYALAPASYVTPIPEGLSSEDAAPMLCAGVTSKLYPARSLPAQIQLSLSFFASY